MKFPYTAVALLLSFSADAEPIQRGIVEVRYLVMVVFRPIALDIDVKRELSQRTYALQLTA